MALGEYEGRSDRHRGCINLDGPAVVTIDNSNLVMITVEERDRKVALCLSFFEAELLCKQIELKVGEAQLALHPLLPVDPIERASREAAERDGK